MGQVERVGHSNRGHLRVRQRSRGHWDRGPEIGPNRESEVVSPIQVRRPKTTQRNTGHVVGAEVCSSNLGFSLSSGKIADFQRVLLKPGVRGETVDLHNSLEILSP